MVRHSRVVTFQMAEVTVNEEAGRWGKHACSKVGVVIDLSRVAERSQVGAFVAS